MIWDVEKIVELAQLPDSYRIRKSSESHKMNLPVPVLNQKMI